MADKQQKCISQSSGGCKSKAIVPCSVLRGCFLGHLRLSSPSNLTWQKGQGAFSYLFYKGTYLIHEDPTLMTYSPPKAPPPQTITFGIRFEHVNFEGSQHSDHSTWDLFKMSHVSTVCSYLLLSSIPWCAYITIFKYLPIEGHLGYIQFRAITDQATRIIWVQVNFSWINAQEWNCWVRW